MDSTRSAARTLLMTRGHGSRHGTRASGWPAVALGLALIAPLGGCTGSGEVKIVPLMRTDIAEREPLVQEVRVDEAYYWIEDQRVHVALRLERRSPLGLTFDFDWQLSLVLDGLPAGSARLYQLPPDSVRMVQTVGPDQRRSRTWTGVAVLHAPHRGTLSGRFHCNVRQQQFTLMGGWQPPPLQAPMLIVVGRFDAVHDPIRGQAILEETQAAGFERTPRPNTAPLPGSAQPPSNTQPS